MQAYRNWVKETRKGEEEPKLPGLPYENNQLFFINFAQVDDLPVLFVHAQLGRVDQ